jgi:hypothetical protein
LHLAAYFFTKKIDHASEYFETSPRITGLPFFQYFATLFSKPADLNKYRWLVPAINFYKKYNTRFDDEWVNCSLFV